jgi:D-amino-acid dehydrogenase
VKVLIIGGGLAGVTTAYFLRSRGYEVTVIERQESSGRETSFANGALLTPSMPEPWNSPGSWRRLLGSFTRSDAALQLRLRALPSLAGWGVRFLMNSKSDAFERNTLSNLRLALYSLGLMQALSRQTGIEYDRSATGILKVFRDAGALDRAVARADYLAREGLSFGKLSSSEVVATEPALAPIASKLAGGIHYNVDETGDAYRFCTALAEYARQQGVEFRFRTEVVSLKIRSGRVTAAVTRQERFAADHYVVTACSYSTPLLRTAGIHLPVRPAKGYSLTFDRPPPDAALRIPVVDDTLHAAVVRLGSVLRVAGTAEFAGYDLAISPVRVQCLLNLARQVLPQARLDPTTARPWCGLRAMSADGVPLIGRTPVSNLLVNTGHGHLGWTMAAGSAQLITNLLSNESPSLDPEAYNPQRFALT